MDKQLQREFRAFFRPNLSGEFRHAEGGFEEVCSAEGPKRMRLNRTRAQDALALARDWIRAEAKGLEFSWVYDEDASYAFDDHDEWCKDARVAKAVAEKRPVDDDRRYDVHVVRGCEHSVEGCVVKDEEGNVLASLWGIVDASDDYRHFVEAELASEALDEWDKREAEKRTDEALRAEAKELYHEEGQIEIEDDAEVSLSEKGAYVAAWVFVPKEG